MSLEKRWSQYHPPPKTEPKERLKKPELPEQKQKSETKPITDNTTPPPVGSLPAPAKKSGPPKNSNPVTKLPPQNKKRLSLKSDDGDSDDSSESDDDDDYGSDSDKKPRKKLTLEEDVKAHSKPPVGKDGNVVPPPPIIGPDGKEVARPRDSKGNPLPIYVTPEGKPVFDQNGKPIALQFDKDGNPIVLAPPPRTSGPTDKSGGNDNKTEQLPSHPPPAPGEKKRQVSSNLLLWVGIVNIIVSLGLAVYVFINVFEKNESKAFDQMQVIGIYYATLALLVLGAIFAGLPIYGSLKEENADTAMIVWCFLSLLILLIQICVHHQNVQFADLVTVIPLCYFFICFMITLYICMYNYNGRESTAGQYGGNLAGTRQLYPGYGQGISTASMPSVQQQQQQPVQQILVQQQQQPLYVYQPQMAAMPAYSYGYPSYGYGYPNYGYGYGLGFGAGIFGHHHHCHNWDWW